MLPSLLLSPTVLLSLHFSSSLIPPSSSELSPPSVAPTCLRSSPLGLLALAFLLPLLELPEPPGPRVSPLDDQAALVRHDPALARRVLIVAQQQVLLAWLDLGAFAGHVLGSHPQELVPASDAALALLVDGDDVNGELPPLACLVRLQDVDLDGC